VQLAVDLGQRHGRAAAREHGEARVAEVFAVDRACGRCDRRDRRRATEARATKASHDVLRVDLRPHHDTQVRELRADLAQCDGQPPLLVVDLVGACEQRGAFGRELRALGGADRQLAIPSGVVRRHASSSARVDVRCEGKQQ
jgi:hypothetical protein